MQRPRSLGGLPAEATVDGPAVLRKEIYNSMKESGIDMESIGGIECFSKEIWFVVFKTRRQREAAKNKTIKLHGLEFQLVITDIERPNYTWVRIFGYPLDSNSTILDKTMSLYGELMSLTDDLDRHLGIKTGVKTAQFKSLKVPSEKRVGIVNERVTRQKAAKPGKFVESAAILGTQKAHVHKDDAFTAKKKATNRTYVYSI